MKKIFTPNFLLVTGMIAVVAATRFFTPLPNFTPIAAIALFGGAYFSRKSVAFLVPLMALAITDLIIGGYAVIPMLAVYSCFVFAGVIGLWIGRKVSFLRVIGGALTSSVVFFIVTNFATWASGSFGLYPMTVGGLMQCYGMGLPFFRNEILGTLVYSGVLFGAFELAKRRFPVVA